MKERHFTVNKCVVVITEITKSQVLINKMTVLSRLIVTKMFDIQRRGAISCSSVSLLLRRYNVHRTLMIQRSFSTETPKSSENELVLRRIREDDDFEDDDVGSKRGGSTVTVKD